MKINLKISVATIKWLVNEWFKHVNMHMTLRFLLSLTTMLSLNYQGIKEDL